MRAYFISFLSLFIYTRVNASQLSDPPPKNGRDIFREFIMSQFSLNCEENITLTTPEQNVNYTYQAANSIRVNTDYVINGSTDYNITMKAGKVIVLKPKTVIYKGGHYLGRIESCERIDGCDALTSLDIPRGISPNGDNKNDNFDLSNFCIDNIKIFNRYGLLVYESDNYQNEWHGQSSNGDLPTATYFYYISLSTGKELTGWIYLQRQY